MFNDRCYDDDDLVIGKINVDPRIPEDQRKYYLPRTCGEQRKRLEEFISDEMLEEIFSTLMGFIRDTDIKPKDRAMIAEIMLDRFAGSSPNQAQINFIQNNLTGVNPAFQQPGEIDRYQRLLNEAAGVVEPLEPGQQGGAPALPAGRQGPPDAVRRVVEVVDPEGLEGQSGVEAGDP